MARTVVTIGTFDGVHRGHAALLDEARRVARIAGTSAGERVRVVALAFDPHPMTRLSPAAAPAMLTEFARRGALLLEAGADEVIRLEPSAELLGMSAPAFIEHVARTYAPIAVVEGADFRFGKARAGDVALLEQLGREHGFELRVVPPVEVELCDQTLVTASSTITRWLVAHGRVGDAARVLGRPYELTGVVVRGNQMGRTIGFPTANLRTPCLLPRDAVYAGMALLPDGREMAAAIHVGTRSTFDDMTRSVEAYVIGWDGLWDESREGGVGKGGTEAHAALEGEPGFVYGWDLRVSLLAHLRDQARFESVGHLVAQIGRDVERAAEIAERLGGGETDVCRAGEVGTRERRGAVTR